MAAAAPIIAIGSAVLGAVGQFQAASRQDDAADEARRLAEMNAAMEEAEAREEERRLRFQSEQEQGRARARAAASGITLEGSPQSHLDAMSNVLEREVDWLRHSSKTRQSAISQRGRTAQLTGQAQAKSSRFKGVGTLLGGVSDFGSSYNWWQS